MIPTLGSTWFFLTPEERASLPDGSLLCRYRGEEWLKRDGLWTRPGFASRGDDEVGTTYQVARVGNGPLWADYRGPPVFVPFGVSGG